MFGWVTAPGPFQSSRISPLSSSLPGEGSGDGGARWKKAYFEKAPSSASGLAPHLQNFALPRSAELASCQHQPYRAYESSMLPCPQTRATFPEFRPPPTRQAEGGHTCAARSLCRQAPHLSRTACTARRAGVLSAGIGSPSDSSRWDQPAPRLWRPRLAD